MTWPGSENSTLWLAGFLKACPKIELMCFRRTFDVYQIQDGPLQDPCLQDYTHHATANSNIFAIDHVYEYNVVVHDILCWYIENNSTAGIIQIRILIVKESEFMLCLNHTLKEKENNLSLCLSFWVCLCAHCVLASLKAHFQNWRFFAMCCLHAHYIFCVCVHMSL